VVRLPPVENSGLDSCLVQKYGAASLKIENNSKMQGENQTKE
jgi:hypothetical protein